MVSQMTRRELLRAYRSREKPMRPPAATPEATFLTRCDSCAECVDVCPQGVLRIEAGTPQLDFSLGLGECTFCGDCTQACPTGALDAEASRPWTWRARIAGNCLSLKGIHCRACQDACEPRAIRFILKAGGRDIPKIDEAACTGCGACSGLCPVSAIRFEETLRETMERVQ